jgi:hypothetical protein
MRAIVTSFEVSDDLILPRVCRARRVRDQPWSDKEIKQLRSLAKANTPTGVISFKMERPPASKLWTVVPASGIVQQHLMGIIKWAPSCGGSSPVSSPGSLCSPAHSRHRRRPWNDGATKKSITDFVARVTAQGSPNFVPVEQRIAVLDNDGYRWPRGGVRDECP